MSHARLAPVIITLLGFATMSACDSEYELDAEMYDALDEAVDLDTPDLDTAELLDPISEGLPDELEAPLEDEQTVSTCLIADHTEVLANMNHRGTVNFEIGVGVPWTNDYDFDVAPVFFHDQLGSWTIKKTPQNTQVATSSYPGWSSFSAGHAATFELEMLATYSTPTPGWVYDNLVTFRGSGVNCSQLIKLRIPDCTSVGWWWTSPWPTPFFDSVNCYVTNPPPGQQSFIYNNNWYVTRQNGQCAIGSFDGTHCYVGSPPGGHTAFIWNGNFYYTP